MNTAAVGSIHFIVGANAGGADFWVDDLSLLCNGPCPAPPFELAHAPAPDTDDATLPWSAGDGASDELRCARATLLSMASFTDVLADPTEKVIMRATIPMISPLAVPGWAWSVKNVTTNEQLAVTSLGPGSATVAIPITEPGQYQVITHTHYPGTQTCGVQATQDAH